MTTRPSVFTRGAAFLFAATVVAGCGDRVATPTYDPNVPASDRYGGTVVVAGIADITTFNPAATADELSAAMQRDVVFMTLLRSNAALEPTAYLAESWTINQDSTQVEFRLRSDVAWHDGTPTTAHDVAFTFETLKDPEAAFANAGAFSGWEGAEVVDDHTIRFAVRPHAGLLSGWTTLPILPRHILDGTPSSELAAHPFSTEPLGNGPFRFAGVESGNTWFFEANDAFPEALGGRPFVDRLVYRSIAEPATQLAELRTGGVHAVRLASPNQLSQAESDPALASADYPDRAYGFIGWNGQRPAFQDQDVRRALTMAIDRQALIDAVRGGLGEVANGPVGTWHPAHDPELDPLPYSPDSAAALLESAGWMDSDGDGLRDREGETFAFEILTTQRDTYLEIAEIVQAQLRQVGIDVQVQSLDGSAFIDRIGTPERRFDAFVLEWVPDLVIDDRQLFSCAARGELFQFTSYCNEELEPTLQAIPQARSEDQSRALLRTYARTIAEEQPFSFLYFTREAAMYRRELQGLDPDIRGDLRNVRDWWIHPDARRQVSTASAP